MTSTTALDERLAEGLRSVGQADLLVGIPSFNNAGTVGHVARVASEGLRAAFPGLRAVVVNADGGSKDGTPQKVLESVEGVPAIAGAYRGLPGKGSAFRAIFQVAAAVGARACAVVDSDLRSITPAWVERLLRPIVEDRADYVTPLYARHKHDGTITNTIAYPFTRALYGLRVRQPIGGEFGFSGELAAVFAEGGALGRGVWDTDVARFGIDIYMTTTAIARGARVAQAFLGAKIHDPKDPGADLAPMFTQVVGTALRLADTNAAVWTSIEGSREVPVDAGGEPVEPEEVRADVALLRRKFHEGAAERRSTLDSMLGADTRAAIRQAIDRDDPSMLAGPMWARVVYDAAVSSRRIPERMSTYLSALVPLYFGRVAAFIEAAADLTTEQAERLVEEQALAFEAEKPYLRMRWERS